MLSSNKKVLDKSLKDNLESYLNNLQINNPNEKINSEFLKKYLLKIEKQLETNDNRLNHLESDNISNINELENLRINWKRNFKNKTEEINNENPIKFKEKRNRRRKSSYRRNSGRIVVRESDVFMKGPWILGEENGDFNLENVNENLEKVNVEKSIINEDNKEQLLDLKMDHSLNSNKIQLNNKVKDKIRDIEKIEEKEIKEIKKKKEKIENKTSEKIEKTKKVEVPKKLSTFFKKYLFSFFGINSNDNEEEKIKDNNQNKKEENRGILSSSSASSLSDNDDMDVELDTNKKSINVKETEDNEKTQMVTIDEEDDLYHLNKTKIGINTTLLDQIENEEINDINILKGDGKLFNNIDKPNVSIRNRSHSFYITEKEKFDYLFSIENQRKRKSDDRLVEIFNETNKIKNFYKRSKTEIDKFDSSTNFNTQSSVNNSNTNIKTDNFYNNKVVNDSNIVCRDKDSNIFYNENQTVVHNNINEEESNTNNSFNNKENPNIHMYDSHDMSEIELNDSKFIRLLKEGKGDYYNTSSSSSYIQKNSGSKIAKSNQKLSILPSDYDFSKIDESFDNLFDKSEEKIIPVNIKPLSSVFNESTIYPVSKNISEFTVDENILNSTMINNVSVNVDNLNNKKYNLVNKKENDISMFVVDGNNNIDKTIIVNNNSNMLLNEPEEEFIVDHMDGNNSVNLDNRYNNDEVERNDIVEDDSELCIFKGKKRKIKNIIVSDDEEEENSFIDSNKDAIDIDEIIEKRESEVFKRQKIYLIDNINNEENEIDDDSEIDDDANVNDEMNLRNNNREVIVRLKRKKRKLEITPDLTIHTNFKRERFNITPVLYKEFNKEIFENQLPLKLEIEWSKTLYKTAGRTQMRRNKEKIKFVKIELSCKVLDDIEKLKNTLVHEMCHVAVFLIDNVEEKNHGNRFKYWGRKAESCYSDIKVTTYHSYKIDYKYKYKCQKCGHIYGRHSKSIDVKKSRCQCFGEIKLMTKLKKDGTPYKKRTEGKFTLFLKENYARIKKEHPKLSHKDIMSLISEEYNNLNNN